MADAARVAQFKDIVGDVPEALVQRFLAMADGDLEVTRARSPWPGIARHDARPAGFLCRRL
jgi:hypothetical protein